MMKMQDAVTVLGSHLNMLPIESGMTLPIPFVENGHVMASRYIYSTRLVAGEGRYLTPPELIGTVDLTAGQFVSLGRLDPATSVELPNRRPDEWKHDAPRFDSPSDLLAAYRRTYELYDVLLPAFVAARTEKPGPAVLAAAREYRELFRRLGEPPMLPFYRRRGTDFFGWLDTIGK